MIEKAVPTFATASAAVIAVVCLNWWLSRDPTSGFSSHVPGMDDLHGKKAEAAKAPAVKIGEFFRQFDGEPGAEGSSWPCFRGADYRNISADSVPLATGWDGAGPPVLWSVELGEGYAAAAVNKGRLYVLDYIEEEKVDALRCFSLADGREIWRRWYNVDLKRNHGFSRTVPAVADRHVVTIGPKCHVMCVDAENGDLRWTVDMVRDYGSTVPGWYAGQCPLIDDGLAILAPVGSNVLVTAIDCDTGATVWSAPNPGPWLMSHASITPMTLGGRRTYVYAAVGGVAGIAADGPDRGTILWQTTEWEPSVIAPSPVVMDGGRILLTAGYGAGSMMIQVSESDGEFTVKKLFRKKPKETIACVQQTPLYYEGHLFSVQPSGAGDQRKQFVCYSPDNEFVWASGKENRFGLGPFMIADGKFLILDDDGVLTMAEATTRGYVQLAQAKVLDGHDSWGPFALVDGMLLLRDTERMICLDMRETR